MRRPASCDIHGGGTPTREDAERDCLSAIAFALERDPRDPAGIDAWLCKLVN